MKEFEYIKDLTSDVGFKAYGKTLEELFVNAGKAISNVMCDISKVNKDLTIKIEVEGKNERDLLYNWLQNIAAEVDIEGMFLCDFKIIEFSKTHIKAECYGEEIVDQSKQETVVKAVTNYLFDLEETNDDNNEKLYIATAVVDI